MTRNMSPADRIVRGGIGMLLLGLFVVTRAPWRYALLIGLVPLGTAITAYCPLYAFIGWNATPRRRDR